MATTDLGDVVRLTWTNIDGGGNPVNAGSVTVTITLPDATAFTSPVITPSSTGVYSYDYTTTQAGRHVVKWVGTGANPGVQAQSFNVLPADPGYIISLQDIKDQLQLGTTSTAVDEELRKFLGSASGIVEKLTGKILIQRSFTEEHVATFDGAIILNHIPPVAITSASMVDSSSPQSVWTPAQLHLEPSGRVYALHGQPGLANTILITYTAGVTVIPDNCILATSIIVQHLWRTQRGPRGTVKPNLEDEVTVPGFAYAVPRRAIELLGAALPGIA